MDFVKAKNLKLTDKSGRAVDANELSGKVVGLYFSAHWCPPCRGFTPALKKFYEEVKASGGDFEILFVSSDKSEAEGKDYFANDHGDWLMVDHSQKDAAGNSFSIKGIPTFIVIDSSGKPVVPDARGAVAESKSPADTFAEWKKLCGDWRESAGSSLGGAPAANDQAAMRAARLARLDGGPLVAAEPAATP
mmetsp:Transcript_55402/g.140437  ORF Transcript_55402/g.140437 Transcript_55402/m.140437 type:complete len:191 (+) Transcript_55402:78-650(+)